MRVAGEDRVDEAAGLAEQAGQFGKYRAFPVGLVTHLISLFLPQQQAGLRETRQLLVQRAGVGADDRLTLHYGQTAQQLAGLLQLSGLRLDRDDLQVPLGVVRLEVRLEVLPVLDVRAGPDDRPGPTPAGGGRQPSRVRWTGSPMIWALQVVRSFGVPANWFTRTTGSTGVMNAIVAAPSSDS